MLCRAARTRRRPGQPTGPAGYRKRGIRGHHLDAEVSAQIGAERERSPERVTYRNGYMALVPSSRYLGFRPRRLSSRGSHPKGSGLPAEMRGPQWWTVSWDRPLDGSLYVWLDGLTQKVREGGRIVNVCVVVATGVNAEGQREILGMDVGASEDGAFWLAFLRSLTARGLSGVDW